MNPNGSSSLVYFSPAMTYILFLKCRFRPAIVKEAIHHVLVEHLTGAQYNGEECTELSKKISDEIKVKLKGK